MAGVSEKTEVLTQQAPTLSVEPVLPKKDPSKFMRKKFRKRYVILPLLAAAAGLVAYKMTIGKAPVIPKVPVIPLERLTLSSQVNLNGMVESAHSTQVYSSLGNIVEQINVKVGDVVQAGDVLAQLDTTDINLSIAQQQAQMAQSARLSQLALESAQKAYDNIDEDLKSDTERSLVAAEQALKRAQRDYSDARMDMRDHEDDMNHADIMIYDAERKLERARDAYEKAEKDYEDGKITAAEFDKAETTYEEAMEEYYDLYNTYADEASQYLKAYRSARLNYQSALEDRDLARKQAQREADGLQDSIEKARASADQTADRYALQRSQQQLADSTIVAPISGTITAVYAKEGAPGSGLLFVIEDVENLVVKTKIREYDVTTVREGMTAEIKSDATGDAVFDGEVQQIYPTAVKDSSGEVKSEGSVEFETDVALKSKDSGLRVGMNVRLNVIREQKKDVYAVPFDALSTNEDGETIVYVAMAGDENDEASAGKLFAQPVVVQTGLETDFLIEISGDGLESGANIISSAQGVTPGMEIQLGTPDMPL
ncbi:MAG: HlyD family efflux transporter periplasmic adaptor subunit [Anaerotruncus sp.]|nr:HlyD family efflux transporter periplasmic adaptor subunit [Anaerotruncus sp.]